MESCASRRGTAQSAIFAQIRTEKTIRNWHTEVDGLKHNGVFKRGLGLTRDSVMTTCQTSYRLYARQLPALDRLWVEAGVNMNDCISTTAISVSLAVPVPYCRPCRLL